MPTSQTKRTSSSSILPDSRLQSLLVALHARMALLAFVGGFTGSKSHVLFGVEGSLRGGLCVGRGHMREVRLLFVLVVSVRRRSKCIYSP